jgi:predicted chitinase
MKIFTPDEKKEDEKKEEKGTCERCKVLSAEEITKVFTGATQEEKDKLRKAFNEANTKFGLDTCQQKAHFFAQVLQEIGVSINVSDGEVLNYKVDDLPNHFKRFSVTNRLRGAPNALAYQYGRRDLHRNNDGLIQKANKEMIANIAYANREGNGDFASGDGWKYRGRGIIQITFKDKYSKINNRIISDFPEFGIYIDANNINNLHEGTIASMAYWKEYGCQKVAKKGFSRTQLDAIVDIVNSSTPSRNNRWTNLQNCIDIFKVNQCKK